MLASAADLPIPARAARVLVVATPQCVEPAYHALAENAVDQLVVDAATGAAGVELLAHAAVFHPDVRRAIYAAGSATCFRALYREGIVDDVIVGDDQPQRAA